MPALGIASDANSVTCPERNVVADPSAKEAAWQTWRGAGLDSIEMVLRGANHLSFDQDISRSATGDAYLQVSGQMTASWFTAHLEGERSGLVDLLGPSLYGAPRADRLSSQFHSAAFVPSLGFDCDQLEVAGCVMPRRHPKP